MERGWNCIDILHLDWEDLQKLPPKNQNDGNLDDFLLPLHQVLILGSNWWFPNDLSIEAQHQAWEFSRQMWWQETCLARSTPPQPWQEIKNGVTFHLYCHTRFTFFNKAGNNTFNFAGSTFSAYLEHMTLPALLNPQCWRDYVRALSSKT